MPDSSNGVYTLPQVYLAITGQTIEAAQHNGPLEDIAEAIKARLPRNGSAPMLADLPMGGKKITGLANGSASTDAATFGQLASLVPVSVVWDYAGTTAPAGWMFCYGQAISRVTYAALFSAIGTTYGPGDGATTFNLPDCRGRVVAGKDDMGGTSANRLTNQTGGLNGDTLGATGGAETHTLTTAQLAAHAHGPGTLAGTTNTTGAHTHELNQGANDGTPDNYFGTAGAGPGPDTTKSAGDHSHAVDISSGTTANAGSGQAHNNLQPTIIFNKIIKVTA